LPSLVELAASLFAAAQKEPFLEDSSTENKAVYEEARQYLGNGFTIQAIILDAKHGSGGIADLVVQLISIIRFRSWVFDPQSESSQDRA
jgi:hypothetical protein